MAALLEVFVLLWERQRKDCHDETGHEEEKQRVLTDGLIQDPLPGKGTTSL